MLVILCIMGMSTQAHAAKAKPNKADQPTKERLVLMPLRVAEEDKSLQGAMETALVEGLQQKYEVFSGEQVSQKAREIFLKESRNTAKKNCDETRCMQNIAEAFQAELIATANVSKQEGGYFLALSIQNIFDNKVEYSKSTPCKNCDSFQVVEKLKELSGAPSPVAAAPAVEKPQTKVNLNDPDGSLWTEAQKGNTAEDYQVYLDTYPKGKYIPFAKARIKKIKDAAQAATEQQEQQAWDKAQQENSEASYGLYLKGYPTGRFAGLAKVHGDKLKNDITAKEEAELWSKANSSNDKAVVEAYLNRYPNGRYTELAKVRSDKLKNDLEEADLWYKANNEADIEAYLKRYPSGRHLAAASAKLKLIQLEEANRPLIVPAMVSIPGKNYEMGKYEVTQAEWQAVMGNNPSFRKECGDTCPVVSVSWNDTQKFIQKLNSKTGKQYRLPTEAEWEYACYGGSQTEYCGGNDVNAVAWTSANSQINKSRGTDGKLLGYFNGLHPVGQKQSNGYGLYDMSGNVWELMNDCDEERCLRRMIGGGSFYDLQQSASATSRDKIWPEYRSTLIGFRLARTLQ